METSSSPFDLLTWIKDHYLTVIIIFLVLYIVLAFMAPVLMAAGKTLPAKMIYRGFSNLCHQFAHRSWFLFGDQAYYPLETRGNFLSIFDVFDVPQGSPENSREIIGNMQAGYKVAVCQRDVALYGALLSFAIIFLATKRAIKQLHPMLWILFAVMPIGIDGLWQLATSYQLFNAQYESSPPMRTVTGVMFGFFSGWLLFPAIEQSLKTKEIRNDNPSK